MGPVPALWPAGSRVSGRAVTGWLIVSLVVWIALVYVIGHALGIGW